MSYFQWGMLLLGVLGFAGTWLIGAFSLGRAVEQLKASLKSEIDSERKTIIERIDSERKVVVERIDSERNKILEKIEIIERRFEDEQKKQDHNFGEVGASVRQYTADVEKKLREVEIYGRDNYVKIPDFEKALDRLSGELKSLAGEIKKDFRELKADISARS